MCSGSSCDDPNSTLGLANMAVSTRSEVVSPAPRRLCVQVHCLCSYVASHANRWSQTGLKEVPSAKIAVFKPVLADFLPASGLQLVANSRFR